MKPVPLLAALAIAVWLAVRWRRGTLERANVVLGGLGIAALVVYGIGVIHPPNIEHVLTEVGDRLGKWTYLLVGAMAYLETGAFVGLVAPGETAILVGGVVAGQGQINVVALIAIVWTCAVAGDLTSFALGRRLGRGFLERHGTKVHITEERLQTVEAFFDRHGGKAILLGRFVGLVRAIAPFLAGASKMPLRRFAPYDIVGAGLWGTTFVLLGYVFWQSLNTVLDVAKKGTLALGSVIVVTVAVINGVRWLREPENRIRVRGWIDTQAQRPALRPLVFVLRPVIRTTQGPARFVWDRITPGDLGLELTTLLAVALVGGFTFGGYASVIDGVKYTPADQRTLELADNLHNDSVVEIAKAVTNLGALPLAGGVLLVAALFLLVRRRALEGLTLLAGMGLTIAAGNIAKAAVDRPRPSNPLVSTDGSSFPSGHAAYALAWVAVAVAIGHAMPIARRAGLFVAALLIAAAVATTRVYLRAHYLSDVLGGVGLGAACFALCGMVALVISYVRQNAGDSA